MDFPGTMEREPIREEAKSVPAAWGKQTLGRRKDMEVRTRNFGYHLCWGRAGSGMGLRESQSGEESGVHPERTRRGSLHTGKGFCG